VSEHRSGSEADHETVTLPAVNPTRAETRSTRSSVGSSTSAPSAPAASSSPGVAGPSASGFGSNAAPDETASLGAKVGAAGAAAFAAANSATSGARQALRQAADRAERTAKGRSTARGRQPRRARLTLSHINVYSVFKLAVVLSIALFFVWLIAVGALYGVLDLTGVLDQVNKAVSTISGDENTAPTVSGGLVFGAAIVIGALNIVLFIALATIGAMVYNLCADLVGGIEVTLSERE